MLVERGTSKKLIYLETFYQTYNRLKSEGNKWQNCKSSKVKVATIVTILLSK